MRALGNAKRTLLKGQIKETQILVNFTQMNDGGGAGRHLTPRTRFLPINAGFQGAASPASAGVQEAGSQIPASGRPCPAGEGPGLRPRDCGTTGGRSLIPPPPVTARVTPCPTFTPGWQEGNGQPRREGRAGEERNVVAAGERSATVEEAAKGG